MMNAWPSIDIVIPTKNSERNIARCLQSIERQEYPGDLRMIVVDGGSTDKTIDIARAFGAEVRVVPNQYSDGINGARQLGFQQGSGSLLWNIDSDNALVEPTVARDLARPFGTVEGLSMTIPYLSVDPTSSKFSAWTNLAELWYLDRMRNRGREDRGHLVVDDVDYGLTNATLLRREVLEAAGGWDTDVRTLDRIRRLGRARGVIVQSAHYFHNQASGLLDYRRKWLNRLKRFGSMSPAQVKDYLVPAAKVAGPAPPQVAKRIDPLVMFPYIAVRGFAKTGNSDYLCGLIHPGIFLSFMITHPSLSRKTIESFLVR